MGKANRIKGDRVFDKNTNVPKRNNDKRKEQNKSRLYTAIIIAIAVFVASVMVISFVSSSGIIGRYTKAVYSDNFTVNKNMFRYMYVSECENFYSNYYYYLSAFGLDASQPIVEQIETKELSEDVASQLGTEETTWKGYMTSLTAANLEQTLTFCEIAYEKGIKLSDTDNKLIDDTIHDLEHQATELGYVNIDGYLEEAYGKGIKAKDVRAALEISMLYQRAAEAVDAEIMNAITEDEIKSKYEEDSKSYSVRDYIFYTMSVEYENAILEVVPEYDGSTDFKFTEAQEAEILEIYKNKIEEARIKAEGFENYTTLDDFKAAVLDDVADTSFDSLYKTEALGEADALEAGVLAAVKAAMMEETIEEIKAGSDPAEATSKEDDKFTAYGETVTENAAKAIENIKTKLYTNLLSANTSFFDQTFEYSTSDEVTKWAFEDSTKIGDTKKVSYGDGADDADLAQLDVKDEYFDISIIMIASDEYIDKDLAKNVAYVTFEDEETAKKAIDTFKAGAKDLASFEALLGNGGIMNGKFENYLEGQFSNTSFETWLYDEGTKIGSITETPISTGTTTDPEYALFFYYADGDEKWAIDVKNAIFVEDYQQYTSSIEGKYTVTIVDKVINSI